jgi:lysozyme
MERHIHEFSKYNSVNYRINRYEDYLFSDDKLLNEAVLILEDASIPLLSRLSKGISMLSSLPKSAKYKVLPYLLTLSMSLGAGYDLRSEVSIVDPESVEILDEIEGGENVEEENASDVESNMKPVYGYTLSLSKVTENWLKTTYLGSRSTSAVKNKFNSGLSAAKEGVSKIFSDWKKDNIHVMVSQKMYDAIVLTAFRAGVNSLRTSEFIQEVKKARHLQAVGYISSVQGNPLDISNRLRNILVAKETELFKSYLKNEMSAKSSGVKIEVPKGYTVHGIDVSKYQEDVDWEKVKSMNTKSGINIDFVFIKATRGDKTVDPKFVSNWSAADNHGLARGAYHFFSAGVSGALQADNFIRNVVLKPGDLPPVLDWEEGAKDKKEALIWLKKVEAHYGVKPIIYTGAYFYKDNMGSEFDGYTLWVSHGPFNASTNLNIPGPAVSRKWSFWQFSDKARVSGIKGYVDFNVFNGTKAEFNKLLIKKKEVTKKPVAKKVATKKTSVKKKSTKRKR